MRPLLVSESAEGSAVEVWLPYRRDQGSGVGDAVGGAAVGDATDMVRRLAGESAIPSPPLPGRIPPGRASERVPLTGVEDVPGLVPSALMYFPKVTRPLNRAVKSARIATPQSGTPTIRNSRPIRVASRSPGWRPGAPGAKARSSPTSDLGEPETSRGGTTRTGSISIPSSSFRAPQRWMRTSSQFSCFASSRLRQPLRVDRRAAARLSGHLTAPAGSTRGSDSRSSSSRSRLLAGARPRLVHCWHRRRSRWRHEDLRRSPQVPCHPRSPALPRPTDRQTTTAPNWVMANLGFPVAGAR